jgi:epoxyqueuosine reductase QueG
MLNSNDIRSNYGFDIVGIVKESSENIIILGLETRPDRDLDEFLGGEPWRTLGFEKHFVSKTKELRRDIKKRGYKIRQERNPNFPIKKYAVMSGIGLQGKNTLVIHPVFHARLRFMALITNMPMEPSCTQIYEQRPNPQCEKCTNLCIEKCCEKVLEEYRLSDKNKTKCKAYMQLDDPTPGQIRCNICWKACEGGKG